MHANKPQGLSPPSIDEMEAALDVLVTKLVQQRHRRRQFIETKPVKIEVFTVAELRATSEATCKARSIVSDPIDWSLKQGMRELGRLLAERCGSHRDLLNIVERLAAHDPNRYWERYSPLESALNNARTQDGGVWIK